MSTMFILCEDCGRTFNPSIEIPRMLFLKSAPTVKKTVCPTCHQRLIRENQIARETKMLPGNSLKQG